MGEGVAIEVNGQAVSSYDVFQRVKWLLYWSRLRPTEAVLVRVEDEARRMLVDESLQLSELRRLGAERGVSFIVPDAEVERRIDRLARQRKLTGAALLSQLVDEDIDSATIYEMFRAQMSWDSFVQSRYAGRITLKPERVRSALELQTRNLERDSFRLREIAVPSQSEGRSQGGMDFAEALWNGIVKGEATFGDIALQFSMAPSASKGGEIGWISLDDLPAGARPTITQMIPGQISPPLENLTNHKLDSWLKILLTLAVD
jgi:peptidyl-prolyl cis-trans isomerase SurA